MWEIFKTFFVLGCMSFGGPAAHIGYFRATFVQRLAWLNEKQYADIVALSQFLPGPGSSQVGFAIGYKKSGLIGALLAFLGFTLPSVILMLLLVLSAGKLANHELFHYIVHGLKLLAVVVVFDAVLSMYKNFCQGNIRVLICLFTACMLLVFPDLLTQMLVLIMAALVGLYFLKSSTAEPTRRAPNISQTISYTPLILFLLLLVVLPFVNHLSPLLAVFSDFYQAGSLVFGGGHVVLPLLQPMVEGQVSADQFLTGYALAQAVPGPMFTFATYIGYFVLPNSPVIGALIATAAVFLPGFLLLLSFLKNWEVLSKIPALAAAISGVNAAVVGLLISVLYDPVFTNAVFNGMDMAMVLLGFYLLKNKKLPIVGLMIIFVCFSIGLYLLNLYY